MRQFYEAFPIRYALRTELSWTHYRLLIRVEDESIVKYSVLTDNENLFASKYRLYLPTEAELKAELIRERELIEREIEQNGKNR